MTFPELTNASSARGAEMGRPDQHDDASRDVPVTFLVGLLPMEDGDYDQGGAYWGGGNPTMYRAYSAGTDQPIDLFFRAKNATDARAVVLAEYPRAVFDSESLDEFTEAYFECALWLFQGSYDDGAWDSEDEEDTEDDGANGYHPQTADELGIPDLSGFQDVEDDSEEAPKVFTMEDFDPDTRAEMVADCAKFQAENVAWLTAEHLTGGRQTVPGQAGHDFWLTRNGHGAGFSDGDWSSEAEDALQAASDAFGEYDLYPGDDGRIYSM